MNKIFVVCVGLCIGFISSVSAKTVESFPSAPPSRVMDYANTFNASQKTALEGSLDKLKVAATPAESFLVVVDSLEGLSVKEYSNQLFRKWKLGNKETNNGLLMVVAKKDRKYRTEVGYGLEGVLPDGAVGRLMRDTLKPYFKKNQFFEGLSEYSVLLDNKLNVDKSAVTEKPKASPSDFFLIFSAAAIVLAFIFIGFSMASVEKEKRRRDKLDRLREAELREQEVLLNRHRIRDSLLAGAAGYAAGRTMAEKTTNSQSTTPATKNKESHRSSSDDSSSGYLSSSLYSGSDSSSSSSYDSGGDSGGGGSSGDW